MLAVARVAALEAVVAHRRVGTVEGPQPGKADAVAVVEAMVRAQRNALNLAGIGYVLESVRAGSAGRWLRHQLIHQCHGDRVQSGRENIAGKLRARRRVEDAVVRRAFGAVAIGVEKLAEVSRTHLHRRLLGGLGRGLGEVEALVGKEEEGAVFAVIELRNPDGAGEIAAVFVALIRGTGRTAVEVGLGRGTFGTVELKQFSVEGVGAAGRNAQ